LGVRQARDKIRIALAELRADKRLDTATTAPQTAKTSAMPAIPTYHPSEPPARMLLENGFRSSDREAREMSSLPRVPVSGGEAPPVVSAVAGGTLAADSLIARKSCGTRGDRAAADSASEDVVLPTMPIMNSAPNPQPAPNALG
jgi:hypothetical protein